MVNFYASYPIEGDVTGGTVTSVGLTVPGVIFVSPVSGSPVTSSGTLALALKTQTANTVFAGPSTGADATPTFRALVTADLPASRGITVVSAATYTTLATDYLVHLTNVAARTITVISAVSLVAGQMLIIKDAAGTGSSANVTINFSGGQTCDGQTSVVISADYGCARLYTDGSNFFTI